MVKEICCFYYFRTVSTLISSKKKIGKSSTLRLILF